MSMIGAEPKPVESEDSPGTTPGRCTINRQVTISQGSSRPAKGGLGSLTEQEKALTASGWGTEEKSVNFPTKPVVIVAARPLTKENRETCQPQKNESAHLCTLTQLKIGVTHCPPATNREKPKFGTLKKSRNKPNSL